MELSVVIENTFQGLKIMETHLVNSKKVQDDLIVCLNSSDFVNDEISFSSETKYLKESTYRKYYGNKMLSDHKLSYNDLLYDTLKSKLYIIKDDFRKPVLPDEGFLLIRPFGYLTSFTNNPSGFKYIEQELIKVFQSQYANKIERVRNIYIPDSLSNIEEISNEGIRPDKKLVEIEKIKIKQGIIALKNIITRIQYNEVNMDTDSYFQRKKGLWSTEIKSRFIEALIVKQPIPAFYFDTTNNDKWLIVDGLQRLSAIKEFVLEKGNPLKLTDLYYLPKEFNNKTFDELDRASQRNIEEFEIVAYNIENPTPDEVKYKIFRSINTSALSLTNQEIRHALNQGIPSKWVAKYAEIPIFKKTIPLSENSIDRMDDRELALRYLAFRIIPYVDYRPTITEFLDDAMTKIYRVSEDKLKIYLHDFGEALFAIDRIFNSSAYRKSMFGVDNDKFTNILFEILTHNFSLLTDNQREILINKKINFETHIKKLGNNEKFMRAIDPEYAYSIDSVKLRFKTLNDTISDFLKSKWS
jgi:hypothetical protein